MVLDWYKSSKRRISSLVRALKMKDVPGIDIGELEVLNGFFEI